jgi:hypothetical protein
MRFTKMRLLLATAASLALVVGAGAAFAATGSDDLKQAAQRLAGRSTFDASVAKNLGTTTAKLKAAIASAASDRIDAALAADEITSAEATALKEALQDGEIPAAHLALPADVAKALDTTVAKLNTAYSDAQKAPAKARVDAALEAGNITEKYATELKAEIDDATFPGFGGAVRVHHERGFGGHGPDGPGFGPGFGLGFGPAFGIAPGDDSGSSTTTTPTTALALA